LKQQNESLKAVIGEMRTQMEKLGQELPQVTLPEPVNKLSSDGRFICIRQLIRSRITTGNPDRNCY
jgi:hypothetical protein